MEADDFIFDDGNEAIPQKGLDFSKIREFAELTERSKELDDEQKSIKARLDELEPVILNQMADEGLQNVRINNRTYYIRRDLYTGPAEGFDKPSVTLALKEAGLGEYVSETYNSNSLSAYVRSLKQSIEDGDMLTIDDLKKLLPEPLQDVLRVGENFRLASRKG